MSAQATHGIEASDVVAMFATLVWKAQLADGLRDAIARPMPRAFVDANASDRERISISFNLMFPAFTETLAKPLW